MKRKDYKRRKEIVRQTPRDKSLTPAYPFRISGSRCLCNILAEKSGKGRGACIRRIA